MKMYSFNKYFLKKDLLHIYKFWDVDSCVVAIV